MDKRIREWQPCHKRWYEELKTNKQTKMKSTTKLQNLTNHVGFVLDRSGSMGSLKDQVVKVFDNQIKYLASRSKELNQETRASIWIFDDVIECLFWDIDVLRLPSLQGLYHPRNMTALIDATLQSVSDLKKIPEIYSDHSYLIYVISDGLNNIGNQRATTLNNTILNLPDNWTIACFVPNQLGKREAKQFGFPDQNIQIWDTTEQGLETAGKDMQEATERFMVARSQGVRGTKSLFNVDLNVSKTQIKQVLQELSPDEYHLFAVHKDAVIKPFVESWLGKGNTYRQGSGYYQLMKPEKIQANKQVCIQDKSNGKVYTGQNARKLINLPDYEIRVVPGDIPNHILYIQSNAINRILKAGTNVLVLK